MAKREKTLSDSVRAAWREQDISIMEVVRRTRKNPDIPKSGLDYKLAHNFLSSGGGCSLGTLDKIAAALGLTVVQRGEE